MVGSRRIHFHSECERSGLKLMVISQNQCDLTPAASVNSAFHSADSYSVHNWRLVHASILLGAKKDSCTFL